MGYEDVNRVVNMQDMAISNKGYFGPVPSTYRLFAKNQVMDNDVYGYAEGHKPVASLTYVDGTEYHPYNRPKTAIINLDANYGRSVPNIFTDKIRYKIDKSWSMAYDAGASVPPVGFVHIVPIVSTSSRCWLHINGVVLAGPIGDWSTRPLGIALCFNTNGPSTWWDQNSHSWVNSETWNVSGISASAVEMIDPLQLEAVRSKTSVDLYMDVRYGSDQSMATHAKFDMQQRTINGVSLIVVKVLSKGLYEGKFFASGSDDLANGGLWLPMNESID